MEDPAIGVNARPDFVLPKLMSLPILASTERMLAWSSSLVTDLLEWLLRFGIPGPTLLDPETETFRISLLVREVEGGGRAPLVRLVDLGLAVVTGVLLEDRDLRFPDVGGGRLLDLPVVRVDLRVALVERVRLVDRVRL